MYEVNFFEMDTYTGTANARFWNSSLSRRSAGSITDYNYGISLKNRSRSECTN